MINISPNKPLFDHIHNITKNTIYDLSVYEYLGDITCLLSLVCYYFQIRFNNIELFLKCLVSSFLLKYITSNVTKLPAICKPRYSFGIFYQNPNDLIFSGHTSLSILLYLINPNLNTFVLSIFTVVFQILTRQHYTVDVIVAIPITYGIFSYFRIAY